MNITKALELKKQLDEELKQSVAYKNGVSIQLRADGYFHLSINSDYGLNLAPSQLKALKDMLNEIEGL